MLLWSLGSLDCGIYDSLGERIEFRIPDEFRLIESRLISSLKVEGDLEWSYSIKINSFLMVRVRLEWSGFIDEIEKSFSLANLLSDATLSRIYLDYLDLDLSLSLALTPLCME